MKRDDIIEYSLYTHYDDQEGVVKRKKIYTVAIILAVITLVEVTMGMMIHKVVFLAPEMHSQWDLIKLIYMGLTLVKAAYIVLVFMHLGTERKFFRQLIFMAYLFFVLYLMFVLMVEANADVHI